MTISEAGIDAPFDCSFNLLSARQQGSRTPQAQTEYFTAERICRKDDEFSNRTVDEMSG
jgi:hypothetical protein